MYKPKRSITSKSYSIKSVFLADWKENEKKGFTRFSPLSEEFLKLFIIKDILVFLASN